MPPTTSRLSEIVNPLNGNRGRSAMLHDKIRVVHVANSDIGLRIHLGNYMRYQRDQGYDVSAVTHPGQWLTSDTTILDGIPVKVMRFEPRLSPAMDMRTLVQLADHFRRGQFDIVHTHTVKAGLLGRLAARWAGVPAIVHTVHGFYFYPGMSRMQYRLYVQVERIGAACCDLILSQNHEDLEAARQLRIGSPMQLQYLGNGIDLARFNPAHVRTSKLDELRHNLQLLPHETVFGFVGRLEREKGICEFLEAARLLSERVIAARYLVIGAAPAAKEGAVEPEQLVRAHGLVERVRLLGRRDDIPELLCLMNALVLPSYGREGIPRVVMEAAAMGIPVVATEVRGIREAVQDGETGLLVPVGDAPALAEAMLNLLSDPERASMMARKARQRALSHFDERQFFRRTDLEYRRLLSSMFGDDWKPKLKPLASH